MRFIQNIVDARTLLLVAVFAMSCGNARYAHAESPTGLDGYVWLDVNDETLPSQDHATIREMMRSARVVSRAKVGRGIAGVEKLVLEHETMQFHAAFRHVDILGCHISHCCVVVVRG